MQIATFHTPLYTQTPLSRSPPAYAGCNQEWAEKHLDGELAVHLRMQIATEAAPAPNYSDLLAVHLRMQIATAKIYKSGLNTRIECVLFEPYRVYLKLNRIQTDLYFLGLRTPSRPNKCKCRCIYVSASDSHLVCRCFSMILSILRMPIFWLAL